MSYLTDALLSQARETGICPVREELYAQCFDELIREVTINCAERGLLLLRVRDEMHMTIAAYQVCICEVLECSANAATAISDMHCFGARVLQCQPISMLTRMHSGFSPALP